MSRAQIQLSILFVRLAAASHPAAQVRLCDVCNDVMNFRVMAGSDNVTLQLQAATGFRDLMLKSARNFGALSQSSMSRYR